MIGIQTTYRIPANVVFTSTVAPATVGLTSPIAPLQSQKIRAWIPFTVGATGGVRSLIAVPAGGVIDQVTTVLYNTVAPSVTPNSANTVFTNALANAGTHWLVIEAVIQNGATAGNVDITIAQNTSDALSLTVLKDGFMEVVTF
jgi:hypothetical protein